MKIVKWLAGMSACAMTGLAMAQVVDLGTAVLGTPTVLPLLEGGILTIAVVGLVAGIRMVQRKNKR